MHSNYQYINQLFVLLIVLFESVKEKLLFLIAEGKHIFYSLFRGISGYNFLPGIFLSVLKFHN